MSRLSNLEPSHTADMDFMYGFCNGNARRAAVEYRRRYPNRVAFGYRSFIAIHRQISELGLPSRRREPVLPAPAVRQDIDEEILRLVTADPMLSVRRIAVRLGISKMRVWRVLKKEGLHPFHFRRAQNLRDEDSVPRLVFCTWILRQHRLHLNFLRQILWTDEATFTRAGITNHRNLHIWAAENPYAVRETTFQHEFSINMWAGIIDDLIIGPFELPNRLTQEVMLNFLRNDLPLLLEDVPLLTRRNMYFQLDGAPAHYALTVREYLNENYRRWIGRGGPVAWPPRSPDLTPLDYYFWGYMKQKVYAVPIISRNQLKERIVAAAAEISANHSEIRRTTKSMSFRALACITANGSHFENLIN